MDGTSLDIFVDCWKEERPPSDLLERVPSVIHGSAHVTILVDTWYWRYRPYRHHLRKKTKSVLGQRKLR